MGQSTYNTDAVESKTLGTGYIFGAPVKDLGWFSSLIMGLASGMMAFFAATFLAIVTILFLNANGHHADFALSYRLIGLPAGVLVAALVLGYLARMRVKRALRKA